MLRAAREAQCQLRDRPIVDLKFTPIDLRITHIGREVVAAGWQIKRLLNILPVRGVYGAID